MVSSSRLAVSSREEKDNRSTDISKEFATAHNYFGKFTQIIQFKKTATAEKLEEAKTAILGGRMLLFVG